MRLHDFFRSSASYRVRIALGLKQIVYDRAVWNLREGEHRSAEYARLNPQRLVPTLEVDGLALGQSLAIIEYLDETRPSPRLLPTDAPGRARVRSLAQTIACDIHPLNNLRVLQHLETDLRCSSDQVNTWVKHWIDAGFAGLEQELAHSPHTGVFCHGDAPSLADICLTPQIFNARRFGVDLSPYPTLLRLADNAAALPAFQNAHPDRHAP